MTQPSHSEPDQTSTDTAEGQQTPIDERLRHTGQGDLRPDVRSEKGEKPGGDTPKKEGAPNQGSEAR